MKVRVQDFGFGVSTLAGTTGQARPENTLRNCTRGNFLRTRKLSSKNGGGSGVAVYGSVVYASRPVLLAPICTFTRLMIDRGPLAFRSPCKTKAAGVHTAGPSYWAQTTL